MRVVGFPSCCAAQVLINFTGPIMEVERDLREKMHTSCSSFNLVILNENQMNKYRKMMDRVGFKVIDTGSSLHLGHKILFLFNYDAREHV